MDAHYSLIDPESLTFWNAEQAILWAMTRDLDVVRGLLNSNAESEEELVTLAAGPRIRHMLPADLEGIASVERKAERDSLRKRTVPIFNDCKAHMGEACAEIRICAQAGDLSVSGRRNGKGDHLSIEPIAWTKLRLAYCLPAVQVAAMSDGSKEEWPAYSDLQFRRDEVMRVFPSDPVPEKTDANPNAPVVGKVVEATASCGQMVQDEDRRSWPVATSGAIENYIKRLAKGERIGSEKARQQFEEKFKKRAPRKSRWRAPWEKHAPEAWLRVGQIKKSSQSKSPTS